MHGELAVRVVERQIADDAAGELGAAVGADDRGLEPPDDHFLLRRRGGRHAAGEAGRVEDLQQRGERLGVAVVRGGRQEQAVREMAGQGAHGPGLLGVHRVALLRGGGGDVVGLVEDEQIEERAGRVFGAAQELAEQKPLGLGAAQPRERDDGVPVDLEGVGAVAALAAQIGVGLGVDDGEAQAEQVEHLALPFGGEPGGADDHDAFGAVAQDQLAGHEPGFDGLPQAHVVGQQLVDPGGGEGAPHRFELVELDVGARAERRLEGAGVGAGERGPAHGVEEGGELAGLVEGALADLGQARGGQEAAARFEFPDEAEGLAERVVGEAAQLHDGVGAGGVDVGDDPAGVADLHPVADRGDADAVGGLLDGHEGPPG